MAYSKIWLGLLPLMLFSPLKRTWGCADHFRLDQPGKPLAGEPVYDQDGIDNCFANAAATLIDGWRRSHPSSSSSQAPTFPLDLTVQYIANHPGSSFHSGGSAATVLEDTLKTGTCEPKLDPVTRSVSHAATKGDFELWMGSQIQDYQDCRDLTASYQQGVKQLGSNQTLPPQGGCRVPTGLNPQALPDLKAVEKAMGTEGAAQSIKETMARVCPAGQRKPVSGYGVSYREILTDSQLGTELETQFSGPNPQPIAVGICANLLEPGGENYVGVDRSKKGGANAQAKPDCEKHEGVIIGERKVNGECFAVFRNSWGSSCNAYRKDLHCENGIIEIPEKSLAKNALEVTSLVEKGGAKP